MGLRSSTPPPSAHDRVVGREWGLQPRSRVPKPHLHTHCRDRGSAHRQVSDCETCFLGRVRRVWAGPGRAEPPCHPATPSLRPPLTQPREPQGGPREDGLPMWSCSPGEGLQVSICPQASKLCCGPWEHLSLCDGRASLSTPGSGGPATWVQWVLQLLRLEGVQLLVLCAPAHYHPLIWDAQRGVPVCEGLSSPQKTAQGFPFLPEGKGPGGRVDGPPHKAYWL